MLSKAIFTGRNDSGRRHPKLGGLAYLATAAAIGLVTFCQYLYLPTFAGYPFQFYFPLVAVAALLFGTGIFAALLSALAALFFFIPPHFSLVITSPGPVVALATFAIASLTIVLVVTLLRRIASHYFRALERAELDKSHDVAVMLEMHHRAASSLHDVAAHLTEQAAAADCEALRQRLRTSARRFSAMGRLHEHLTLPRHSTVRIEARKFLQRLCEDLQESLPGDPGSGKAPPRIAAMIEAGDITHRQATTIGHLISELAEETCRRSPAAGGIITVNLSGAPDGGGLLLVMHDGAAPAGMAAAIARRPIINTLVRQLRGSLEIEQTLSPAWLIRFPAEATADKSRRAA